MRWFRIFRRLFCIRPLVLRLPPGRLYSFLVGDRSTDPSVYGESGVFEIIELTAWSEGRERGSDNVWWRIMLGSAAGISGTRQEHSLRVTINSHPYRIEEFKREDVRGLDAMGNGTGDLYKFCRTMSDAMDTPNYGV